MKTRIDSIAANSEIYITDDTVIHCDIPSGVTIIFETAANLTVNGSVLPGVNFQDNVQTQSNQTVISGSNISIAGNNNNNNNIDNNRGHIFNSSRGISVVTSSSGTFVNGKRVADNSSQSTTNTINENVITTSSSSNRNHLIMVTGDIHSSLNLSWASYNIGGGAGPNCTLSTTNGNITVQGNSEADLSSTNGKITVSKHVGPRTKLSVIHGSIIIDGNVGPGAILSTVNGSINVKGVTDTLATLKKTNGSITVKKRGNVEYTPIPQPSSSSAQATQGGNLRDRRRSSSIFKAQKIPIATPVNQQGSSQPPLAEVISTELVSSASGFLTTKLREFLDDYKVERTFGLWKALGTKTGTGAASALFDLCNSAESIGSESISLKKIEEATIKGTHSEPGSGTYNLINKVNDHIRTLPASSASSTFRKS